jgi:two-component system chemotaxis response regulator CheY
MLREELGILVVDDVNTMRIQIKELLKGFGFKHIVLAGSGAEAKQFLQTEKIHLILSDWQMSPTDGIELLQFVRSSPEHKDIAFIMVTAESTKEKVMAAIQAGVDNYLVKPLTPTEIESKVYGVLLKKQLL